MEVRCSTPIVFVQYGHVHSAANYIIQSQDVRRVTGYLGTEM